jgi:hypothetical protein
MIANIHPETGIAYGYVAANDLDQDIIHTLMYGDQATDEDAIESYKEFVREWRSKQEDEWDKRNPTTKAFEDTENPDDPYPDPEAEPDEHDRQSFWDGYESCEPAISGTYKGVEYRTSWLGGALNFFILKSPHITQHATEASPCVPNAAILPPRERGHVQGYTVPDDWWAEHVEAYIPKPTTEPKPEADNAEQQHRQA